MTDEEIDAAARENEAALARMRTILAEIGVEADTRIIDSLLAEHESLRLAVTRRHDAVEAELQRRRKALYDRLH